MMEAELIKQHFGSDWISFYQRYISTHIRRRHGNEITALCPFHDDHTPSLSINIKDGTWFCHACGEGGDAFSFYQKLHHVDFADAVKGIAQDFGLGGIDHQPKQEKMDKFIQLEVVEELHQALLSNSRALRLLEEKRGLALETVKRFKLGYKADRKRLAIPIFDSQGRCVNIRLYSLTQEPKMLSWAEGYGAARLYPVESLEHNPIWLMEGELDALLAIQDGLNAVTATGGAGTWKEKWDQHFKGKDVIIAYDNDGAGKEGARKVAEALEGVTQSVLILDWPEDFQEHGDYTDWRVKQDHSATDFLTLPNRPLPAPEKPSSIPTSTLDTRSLSFPSEAYTGQASEFAELYSSFTEAPRSFYYMAFLTALGTVIGHKVTLESEIEPQPRLYTALLGESADDRKSTAIKLTFSSSQ